MLVVPSLAPIKFRLKHVKNNQLSGVEHTPLAERRVTQDAVGVFAYPLPNLDGEYVIRHIPPKILDKMAVELKAFWVGNPADDAEFLHEIYRTYTPESQELDPRFQLKPTLFPRSYNYELDCLESRRLVKLNAKMTHEEAIKLATQTTCGCLEFIDEEADEDEDGLRWQARPKLFAKSQTDPCLRRAEFAKIGQRFRNEACHFYNVHYPPAKLPFIRKSFS